MPKQSRPPVSLPSSHAIQRSALVVSERDAAAMLALSPRTLQAMRVDGSGPRHLQLTSRRIGYSVATLEQWVEARSRPSTSARGR